MQCLYRTRKAMPAFEDLLCLQMWKQYIPNAKVSYLEYDAACATKHKTDIEAQAGGTLYIGTAVILLGGEDQT